MNKEAIVTGGITSFTVGGTLVGLFGYLEDLPELYVSCMALPIGMAAMIIAGFVFGRGNPKAPVLDDSPPRGPTSGPPFGDGPSANVLPSYVQPVVPGAWEKTAVAAGPGYEPPPQEWRN